jgi:hypothetical protein
VRQLRGSGTNNNELTAATEETTGAMTATQTQAPSSSPTPDDDDPDGHRQALLADNGGGDDEVSVDGDGATTVAAAATPEEEESDFLGVEQRELGATVICDAVGERVLVVKTFETHHVVWEFIINTDDSTLSLHRRVTLSPPLLSSSSSTSTTTSTTPTTHTTTNQGSPGHHHHHHHHRDSMGLLKPLDTHSVFTDRYVLLGNTMEYQVWHLDQQRITRSMTAPLGTSFVSLNIMTPAVVVVAITRDEIIALNLEEGAVSERHSAVKYSAIITQSWMGAELIVCGDVDGYVHVLKHNRRAQDIKPQNLAISQPDFAIGDHPASTIRSFHTPLSPLLIIIQILKFFFFFFLWNRTCVECH